MANSENAIHVFVLKFSSLIPGMNHTHIVMMTTERTTKFVNCMTHWAGIHVVVLGNSHVHTRQNNYCNHTFMPRDE